MFVGRKIRRKNFQTDRKKDRQKQRRKIRVNKQIDNMNKELLVRQKDKQKR
jgi:hypothetical protein